MISRKIRLTVWDVDWSSEESESVVFWEPGTPPEALYLALLTGWDIGRDGWGNIHFGGGLEVGKKAVALSNFSEETIVGGVDIALVVVDAGGCSLDDNDDDSLRPFLFCKIYKREICM